MPNSPLTRQSIRLLIFSYVSALTIILFLLFSGQALIQWTLLREVHMRSVIAQVNAQELRTQRMFYNVLLLQDPTGNGIDYLGLTAKVETDEATWETVQQAMYQGDASLGIAPADFSDGAQTEITKARPGFLVMEQAYRHIFALERRDHPASPDLVRPDVDIIYLGEGPYLQSLVMIYTDLVAQADGQVALVRLIEGILFGLTLAVLSGEVFFVVKPAISRLSTHMRLLAKVLEDEKRMETLEYSPDRVPDWEEWFAPPRPNYPPREE